MLLAGLKMTVILTVSSIFFALILGIVFGLARVSRSIWLGSNRSRLRWCNRT